MSAVENFPARLREIREHQGLSQRALGELLGLTGQGATTEISRYETGTRVPSLARLDELAEVLEVEATDLITPESNPDFS